MNGNGHGISFCIFNSRMCHVVQHFLNWEGELRDGIRIIADGWRKDGGGYSIKRRCSNEGCMQSSTILLIRLHVFYIFSFCYLYDVICLLYDALKCP